MEIRCPPRESAQNRAFDLADMIELSINQGLAEIRGSFAFLGWPTCGCVFSAHGDFGQVTYIQTAQVDRAVAGARIAGPDIQRMLELLCDSFDFHASSLPY